MGVVKKTPKTIKSAAASTGQSMYQSTVDSEQKWQKKKPQDANHLPTVKIQQVKIKQWVEPLNDD